ncbi:exportin CRM1 [Aspergillus homomorphus CBS 101889]|uniref:Nuclear transport receptor n=1 Tax=Aspergillus homomorphus (strain CBS 101889) TaxID=1450537 RepID=A0A395I1T8_ASPHC|nr:nuclear transport receptor [Aspergillus homomorphus CBS 101889]RAL13603.1 nuclear transport receptor [Aspergillus homomorphus CBS 101889]
MSVSIQELDNTVRAFYEGKGDLQKQAQQTLTEFKANEDAWMLAANILQESSYPQTKYLALQVLDDVIMTRWKILPRDQCLGIRNFVVQFILNSSESEEKLRSERALLNKLNLVLVSILKQEWPHNWPTFINDIITSCHTGLSICENNMAILRLLSEEVFDFSQDQMTSVKARNLKTSMTHEFSSIFQLCSQVLSTANQPSLIKATLETLLRFLNWIPLGYIFETSIINTLLERFLDVPEFRNVTLKCLTEIGGLQIGNPYNYDDRLVHMFTETLTVVSRIIPLSMDLKQTYSKSNSRDQEFVLNLALFLCSFFSAHLNLIEKLPNHDYLTHAHFYLIRISQIDDREVFKICLEYWTKLVQELYEEMQQLPITDINPLVSMGVSGLSNGGAPHPSTLANYPALRKHKYDEVLSSLRTVMIEKMVRPEEVLIVENDEGEIVREFVKESDTIQLYKTIRECLVYLTHLDVIDTENIMIEKLAKQVDGSEWSWVNCNTLCWAIGSISGAMNEETEKRFLVNVIKDLLGLTEMKRGKDNKAVVASNIMYIVGQYPRFLKAHWKFLKTVVNKLFEFMHETHEGVQDMACDTFIKIANKCRRHFVALQPGENEPFIEEIVRNMRKITCDLSPQQVHTFYEACGYMISAQGQKGLQDRLIENLMSLPNAAWDTIIGQATQNPQVLEDGETIKIVGNIMKTNVAACSSIGTYFYSQLGRIYHDMLNMFRASSQLINNAVAQDGEIATKTPKVRGLRTIKKEILKLIDTYVQKADDLEMVNVSMVPPLLEAVLVDYNHNVPDAREAEVLNVMTTIIHKLHNLMEDKVPLIMESVFECTLEMINKDYHEYPEHRVQFFKLLQAINLYCFPALLKLQPAQFKIVIDSCMWASKHDNREVETTGLTMCLELINNMAETDPQTSNVFFHQFFLQILGDVFFVLCDSDHKAGFKSQAMLLSRMFYLIESGKVQQPIYTADKAPLGTTNKDFLQKYLADVLIGAFKNLKEISARQFVAGLFTYNDDFNKFKTHLRDFLISLKEYSGDDAELYADEREQAARDAKAAERDRALKVGGLLKPSEMDEDEEI